MSPSDDSLSDAPPGRRRRPRLIPRSRKGKLAAGLALVLVLGGAGAGGWYLLGRGDAESPAAMTQTIDVSSTTLKTTVASTGTLEPAQRADLAFGASSTVTGVKVTVGDTVEEGQTLATIDDSSLRAALNSAKADLKAAEDALDELEDDDDATDSALAAARASVLVKENSLADARANLKGATMTAPFGGLVAEVNIADGDSAGGSASGSGGSGEAQPGAMGASNNASSSSTSSADIVLISADRYTVSTSVPGADIAKVRRGLQAEIAVDGSDETIYGTVSSVAVVASSSSSGSATFPVTIDVTGAQEGLFAGSSAEVSIIVSQLTDVIAVPAAAISTAEDGTSTVTKLVDGVETPTEVSLGETVDSTVVIAEGLAEGDQIVVTVALPRSTGDGGDQQFTGFPGGGDFSGFPGGDVPGGGFPGGGQMPGGGQQPGGGPNR